MFTVCPKCALTLVVTAADLRVAQGYVRCGRCSSVFNALAQLSDERTAAAAAPQPEPPAEPEQPEEAPPEPPPPPAPAGPRTRAPAKSPPARAAVEDPVAEEALEFNPAKTDVSSVFVTPPPNPEWTAATGSFKALIAANQEPIAEPGPPAGREPVDVELDAALLSEIMEPDLRPASAATPGESAAAAAPAAPAAAAPSRPMRRAGPARPPAGAAAEARAAPPAPQAQLQADELPGAAPSEAPQAPSAGRAALPWAIGAALLALALLLQIIDHQRDALAADARFNRPLTALYSALGVRLVPRWDLRAYDVRQLGASVEPGSLGAITVRASIRNVGAKAQPLPLLRVTLQDRFGNRLASREVGPGDYLPRSLTPPVLMSVDQRIDAQLAFVDPGASAVGFELDACLPARGGGVACANDASAR